MSVAETRWSKAKKASIIIADDNILFEVLLAQSYTNNGIIEEIVSRKYN